LVSFAAALTLEAVTARTATQRQNEELLARIRLAATGCMLQPGR